MKAIFEHVGHGLHTLSGGLGIAILALIVLCLLTILPRVEKSNGKK